MGLNNSFLKGFRQDFITILDSIWYIEGKDILACRRVFQEESVDLSCNSLEDMIGQEHRGTIITKYIYEWSIDRYRIFQEIFHRIDIRLYKYCKWILFQVI